MIRLQKDINLKLRSSEFIRRAAYTLFSAMLIVGLFSLAGCSEETLGSKNVSSDEKIFAQGGDGVGFDIDLGPFFASETDGDVVGTGEPNSESASEEVSAEKESLSSDSSANELSTNNEDTQDGQATTHNQSSPGATSSNTAASNQDTSDITVTVTVDTSAVSYDGWPAHLCSGSYNLAKGASAYDALCATGLALSGSKSYVSSIGGLAEKQYGGASGWMYSVNETTPMTAACNYKLKANDKIRWYYVT